jgi:hypothetical protein
MLLDYGARVNSRDGQGRYAAVWAIAQGHADCLRVLLLRGRDVDSRTSGGEADLPKALVDLAVAFRQPVPLALLGMFRPRSAVGVADESALALACCARAERTVELLVHYGSSSNADPTSTLSPT